MADIRERRLNPIIKWAGGKENELKHILSNIPYNFSRYFEPFVGGGAVYFSIDDEKMFINDKSHELINLYKAIQKQDNAFFYYIIRLMNNWKRIENIVTKNEIFFKRLYLSFRNNSTSLNNLKNLIYNFVLKHSEEFNGMLEPEFNVNIENFIKEIKRNLIGKIRRMREIEKKKGFLPEDDISGNIESALKSAFYMHFIHLYNNIEKYKINQRFETAIFFFIRNYAYSGMFRYNKKGEFNVPYGGIGYNRKNLDKKIDYFKNQQLVEHLSKTTIENMDFEDFLDKHNPCEDDFVFLDPPYDSEFKTYAKNDFAYKDHKRLAYYLLNKCKARWMLVIKNTDFIHNLYANKGLNIHSYGKKYLVSFMDRNNKNTEHLLITNYELRRSICPEYQRASLSYQLCF